MGPFEAASAHENRNTLRNKYVYSAPTQFNIQLAANVWASFVRPSMTLFLRLFFIEVKRIDIYSMILIFELWCTNLRMDKYCMNHTVYFEF